MLVAESLKLLRKYVLLFFEIPEEFSLGNEFQGILLFVILASCLIMTLSLIAHKNKLTAKDVSEEGVFLGGDGVEEISKEKTSENI